ncbi:MAG TPA: glycosyltransferase family 39 protein [Pyrinomonadaceae bacterium]|jgi:4-amino-4-deoxy-L-arabinose transferase-like glycosyltransferase|nr:glycosyltransferase family 39 protein [Pyrinomonadaceae bacterium]
MQAEKPPGPPERASFRATLRARLPAVLLLMAAALGLRLFFIFAAPRPSSWAGDARYYVTAANLLAGHGYSWDEAPPYRPSIANVPAYTLFIAAVYAVAGHNDDAVRVAQALLDLLTCLLVAYLSFGLAPPRLKRGAALAALAVYGLLSWFTMVWTTCLLSETLTLFLTVLTVALCARALEGGGRALWAASGAACGLAILTRPDSVLLAGAVLVFLGARAARARRLAGLLPAAGFCLALALTLAPWTLRNYLVFGVFEPLANEYGCPRGCYFPVGYLHWLRTWLGDETHFAYAFNPAWAPPGYRFDPAEMPGAAYDSEEERRRLVELAGRYNRDGYFTPELDAEFRALAIERAARAPVRTFVRLPLYRLASMWLTGFSTSRPTPYLMLLRVFSVVPIHVGALLCFVFWGRGSPLGWLLLAVVLVRSAFFGFHYAPETRYIVEAYPAAIAACGVTAAAGWDYLSKLWGRARKGREVETPQT